MGLTISTETTAPAVKDVVETEKFGGLEPRAHRYKFLKVNEVSIVTEPAILSQEEADKGVGFPIVKFVEEDEMPVAAATKSWMQLVVEAAKSFLTYYVEDGKVDDLEAVKLSEDTIILTSPYKNISHNNSVFFKLLYKQDEAGNITFIRPKKFQVTFEANEITSEKVYEIVKELPMSQITGVEVGGKIVKITPIPGIEFESEDGELIFRCDSEGVLKTGENYSIDDDGVVRKTSDIAPVEEAEVDTSKFYLTLEQIQELMATSGKSYNFSVGDDGCVKLTQIAEIDPALTVPGLAELTEEAKGEHYGEEEEDDKKKKPMKAGHEDDKKKPMKMGHDEDEEDEDKKKPKKVAEVEAEAQTEVDDLSLKLKQLEDELAKAKQKLAGSSTTDPEVGENAVKVFGYDNFPVEKDHKPVDGNFQRGIFTRHIDKRLLDRGSRLQADLISG